MFTEQEDTVIRAAIEEAGDGKVNCKAISEILKRHPGSVSARVSILKRDLGGRVMTKFKHYTLDEDLILLEELVIPRLRTEKLSELKLRPADYAELGKQLGKSRLGQRWDNTLQMWLLQHYAGTLNLKVEVTLSSYIEDTFSGFSDIDWTKVAAQKEFAGHTDTSLNRLYMANLKLNMQKKFNLCPSEATVGHVAEYCRQVHGEGKGKKGGKKEERQQKVMEFFQRKVEELGFTDFL